MEALTLVKNALVRLWGQDSGWSELFSSHGWTFSSEQIRDMADDELLGHLVDDIANPDRNISGFADFSLEGVRLIEPGIPSRSLLYHAFASPDVQMKIDGVEKLGLFPTLFEIDAVENLVYATKPLDINDLIKDEGSNNVAVVAFSYEYRPLSRTTHRKYSDLCFSRTGVARVGTVAAVYEDDKRGFDPLPSRENDKNIPAMPARYGAFIAVRREIGNEQLNVLPFMGKRSADSDSVNNRAFWVPVHKLFAGDECIVGESISVSIVSQHENIKLKKVCEYVSQTGNRDLAEPPYTIQQGLAEVTHPAGKEGSLSSSAWVVPKPHPLVEEAKDQDGKFVTIHVPQDSNNAYFATLTIPNDSGARPAPEYVNVRKQLMPDGTVVNLNEKRDVSALVALGGYDAIMHNDYTADGWVKVISPEISNIFQIQSVPAYSLITAPDFAPYADQREILEWSESGSTPNTYWALKPWSLADTRMLPNLTLPNAGFPQNANDNTIETGTAIICPLETLYSQAIVNVTSRPQRSSFLPDSAAGEFQPGWDVTWDRDNSDRKHLAAYGLGSPFMEDAKLCAALSTFWPAAAPDIARSYARNNNSWPSICPLTDEEIGQVGDSAWDGVSGPFRINISGDSWVQYPSFNHVDYVSQALNGEFSISQIGKITSNDYKNRVDALWHVYRDLGAINNKAAWSVLSFRIFNRTNQVLINDIGEASVNALVGDVFAITIYQIAGQKLDLDKKRFLEKVSNENHYYVDSGEPRKIWRKNESSGWMLIL